MSAEIKNENIMFILPEDIKRLRKNKNTPDIEEAIRNIEKLQKQGQIVDNTVDFVEIETESIVSAIQEQDLDCVLKILPTYIRDVRKLISKLRGL